MRTFANKNTFLQGLYLVAVVSFGLFIIVMAWDNTISSFSNDSANYMLMALYLSPWQTAAMPVQLAWNYQDYPQFFPFILALTGTVHNFISAHMLIVLFQFCSLPLIYLYSRNVLHSAWQAKLIVLLFIACPVTWLTSMDILSENLYLFLSLLFFCLYQNRRIEGGRLIIAAGLCLAFLVLTRTIGFSLFLALIITSVSGEGKSRIGYKNLVMINLIVIAGVIINKLLFSTGIPSQYLAKLDKLGFMDQLVAITDAWFVAWQIYWLDDFSVMHIAVALFGFISLAGLAIRLFKLHLDAVYVFIYLLIILGWPFPGQSLRFLYPAFPFLLVYIVYILNLAGSHVPRMKPAFLYIIFMIFSFFTIIPTYAYTIGRYLHGIPLGYQHIREFYRTPDLDSAKLSAEIQSVMHSDMDKIRKYTANDDVILYFEVTYIALLADRPSLPLSVSYKNNIYSITNLEEGDYVYLSRLNPKVNIASVNGLSIFPYIKDQVQPIWINYSANDGRAISAFMKIIKTRL